CRQRHFRGPPVWLGDGRDGTGFVTNERCALARIHAAYLRHLPHVARGRRQRGPPEGGATCARHDRYPAPRRLRLERSPNPGGKEGVGASIGESSDELSRGIL